jgi:hypothetical protein
LLKKKILSIQNYISENNFFLLGTSIFFLLFYSFRLFTPGIDYWPSFSYFGFEKIYIPLFFIAFFVYYFSNKLSNDYTGIVKIKVYLKVIIALTPIIYLYIHRLWDTNCNINIFKSIIAFGYE